MSSIKLAKAKKEEMRKSNDNFEIFDALMVTYYGHYDAPSRQPLAWRGPYSRGQREKLVLDVRGTIGKLQRSRQGLMELMKGVSQDSADHREMDAQKVEIEARMERHIQWEADLKKTPHSTRALTEKVVLTSEQQATADALAFLTATIDKLKRQIEVSSATVERALARNRRLREAGEPEDDDEAERAARIGELNDEREWHVARLEKVERMLLNEETEADKVFVLRNFLRVFLESDEDEGFETSPELYRPFGLDLPPTGQDPLPAPSFAAPIFSDDGGSNDSAKLDDDCRAPDKTRKAPASKDTASDPKRSQHSIGKAVSGSGDKARGSNHRTAACRTFSKTNSCQYGDRCTYRHSLPGIDHDVRDDIETMARTPCKFLTEHGRCYRSDCLLSHSESTEDSSSLYKMIERDHPTFGVPDIDVPPDLPAIKALEPARPAEQKPAASPAAWPAKPQPPVSATAPIIARSAPAYSVAAAFAAPPAVASTAAAPPKAIVAPFPVMLAPSPPKTAQTPKEMVYPSFSALAQSSPAPAPAPGASPRIRAATAPEASGSTPLPPALPVELTTFAMTAVESASAPAALAPSDDASATTESRVEGSQSSRMWDSESVSDASSFSIDRPPFTPTSNSPVAPVTRLPGNLLPLDANACLNHMLRGVCLNGPDCMSRHTLGQDDFAAGILPLLGPGACLNHFLRGSCANVGDCLARHALTEDDFVASPTSQPGAKGKDALFDRAVGRPTQNGLRNSSPGLAPSPGIKLNKQAPQPAQPAQPPKTTLDQPAVPVPNHRRAFTDPRMKDPRFRDRCCRFYLQGHCPYGEGGCFDIHPRGAFDLVVEDHQTTFFVPDEGLSDDD